MQTKEELTEKVRMLPDNPGVYIMRNAQDTIIYVGKAVNLKNRVRTYFQSSRNQSPKVAAMVSHIATFEYIVTASEIEALILECNLIKKHHPKYNISLRDDKTYPYIRVNPREPFPRVLSTRSVKDDGARYFGPYANAGAMHETLRLLKKLFPLRTCKNLEQNRPCLQYHIKRCLAPCAGKVTQEAYAEMIQSVILLLEGRNDDVVKKLRRDMTAAAENLEFEKAARLRDQLAAVEKVTEKQNVVTGAGDQDVVGLARSEAGACVQVFFVRSGKLIGRDYFMLNGGEDESDAEVLGAFVQQYYSRTTFIPQEILLPREIPDAPVVTAWLTEQKGRRVVLEVPQRGTKHDLVTMASGNAAMILKDQAEQKTNRRQLNQAAVEELQRYLALERPPVRMECFDISHIQGSETVASMVVFEDGMPKKEDYRRFRLTTVDGPNDFASMQEVVGRRYRDAQQSSLPLPNLIVIDGGKGQLSASLEVIRGLGLTMPVVGLAKRFEYIFQENCSDPVILPRYSPALHLVQRIRDEAHRFAITYHRNLRRKRNLQSVLDQIEGIGPKRRQALWQEIGSLEKIKAASLEELAAVPGMNHSAALAVVEFFRRESH